MANISPKIVVINHFDKLINKVDLEFDHCIGYFDRDEDFKTFEDLYYSDGFHKRFIYYENFSLSLSVPPSDKEEDLWPKSKSRKILDYLKQLRMETIEMLKKAQEEALENYKLNRSRFINLKEITDEEKMKSVLFAEKYYFQVDLSGLSYNFNPWIFSLFTFVTDFYLSPTEIEIIR